MYVITGATGALNGATVERLLESVPAAQVAVVARDVTKAAHLAARGVTVRRGDYAEPASLREAFAGADQLLLVSSSDPGADAVTLHRNAVDAAVSAGAGRILYTSHQGAGIDSPFGPARDHAATERLLAESGLPWTALRNGFYAHSLAWLVGDWRSTGSFSVPVDGPVSWTSRDDAAEAAAAVLLSDGAYDGAITLTAGAAPTFDEVATIAGDIAGRHVERLVVGDDAWLAEQTAAGTPEFMARFTLGIYLAAAEGRFAGVDPLLARLLGREPRTVRELLAEPAARSAA
jgi:NAD(P)H dehydrogenase (quinone)